MQTYQSQCSQPKRRLAYFAKCGDGDKGKDRAFGDVAEASFPVADRKAGQVSMHAGVQRETVNAAAPHCTRFRKAQQRTEQGE